MIQNYIISKKFLHFYICLILLFLPLYLFKIKIWLIPLTVLELMIYGLFVLWLLRKRFLKARFGDLAPKWGPSPQILPLPVFLIFLGLTISTLFSFDLLASAGIWKGWFIAPWLFMIVILDIIKNQEQTRDILIALTFSGFIVAAISFWYWFSGHLAYDGRLTAFYLSPNHLAMYLAPILILSFNLWLFIQKKWQKMLLLVVSCLLLAVIYLTYSYGAWLGLLGAIIFLIVTKKQGSRGQTPIFLFGLLLVIILIFFQFQTEKAQNLLKFSRSSLESRLIIWRTAIEIIKDHPLIGIGPGMFQRYYLAKQPKFEPYLEWAAPQPHNLFLAFWLQTGLIGLIGFIWLLFWFFRSSSPGAAPRKQLLILKAALVYILIHGLADTTYWKNDLAIIFWLIIALRSITARLSYSQKTNNPLEEREGVD